MSLPASSSAAFGEAHTLAPFPASPGFPEGIAVKGDRVYAAGAATLGTTGSGPSAVIAYDRATGAVVRRYDTVGENLLAEHGGSSIAFDGEGRLFVLNTQLGVLRINTTTGAQERYAPPFPHLSPCLPLLVKAPCTPNPLPIAPLPNDIAFAPNGDAYVTDSFQATIWRIPKGGDTPQIWFQSPRFASAYVGVNGLRLNPAGTRVYVTVTIDLEGRASLYSLPLKSAPAASDLQLEHRFAPGELPDGIAFGATGQLFISMASPTAPGFLVRNTDGTIAARVKNPPLSLNSRSTVRRTSPSTAPGTSS